MKVVITLFTFLCFYHPLSATQNPIYAVKNIPVHLLKNADAVIRHSSINKEIWSADEQITRCKYAITILTNDAQSHGYFREFYDEFSDIYDYSLKAYDAEGNEVYEADGSDFEDLKAFTYNLFDKIRIIKLDYSLSRLPYTIEIEFSQSDEHTLYIVPWMPIQDFGISLQHAKFSLKTPNDYDCRILENNIPGKSHVDTTDTEIKRTWTLQNIKAIEKQFFMPEKQDIFPNIMISANEFEYDGYKGSLKTWKDIGEWRVNLLKNRDELPAETKQKLITLTKNATTVEEKTRILYNYLQENTRYVSVQLGIGGFQPFKANVVDEKKYGDCKALSNYMISMLKAVGVKSHYVAIKNDRETTDINPSFPSHQFNHIIVCVPDAKDTLWLECTSQSKPFGYIGFGNHNRHCLLVTPGKSALVKTPDYSREHNVKTRKGYAELHSNRVLTYKGTTTYKGLHYELMSRLFRLSPEDQKNELYESLRLNDFKINQYDLSHKKEMSPSAKLNLNIEVNNYASGIGNRLFIPLNILSKSGFVPAKTEVRKYPIFIRNNRSEIDTTFFKLPTDFKVEHLPKPVSITTEFGEYRNQMTIEEDQMIYIRELHFKKGTYPAQTYGKLRDFFVDIKTADHSKAVLIKP